MLFSCFRGTPIQLASTDHIKPQHVCCAVVGTDHIKPQHVCCAVIGSVHFKCMQKKEDERKSSRFISNSETCQNSIPVRSFHLAPATCVRVASPVQGTRDTCQHQAKGRGSLPRSCNLLISLGDSNDLMPILWVGVSCDLNDLMPNQWVEVYWDIGSIGDLNDLMPFLRVEVNLNILMPMLRVGDAVMLIISHVTFGSIPVDLSGDNLLYPRPGACSGWAGCCRLLCARCPGLGDHSDAAAARIDHPDLTVLTAAITSGFIHCLQIVECDYEEDIQITDLISHTCHDLYQYLDLYLVTGKPLHNESVTPA